MRNKRKINMGVIDRVIRILIAALVVGLFFTYEITGITAFILVALMAVLIITSLVGYCPLYKVLRIRTNKKLRHKSRA